jgi:signal transduction histidine kinase
MPPRILIVDDERDACTSLRRILRLDGYEVDIAHRVSETMIPREWSHYLAVVLDRKLPDGTAETLLPWIRQRAPSTAIIIVTGYADLESSIAAIREGIEDYIIKPINPDILRASLARISRMRDAEARAVQAERLAAIGQMVASLAHESRNLLQRMSASIEMLELIDADNPDATEEIAKIRNAERGLEQLLEEVREFAAPIHLHKKSHSLQSIWNETWSNLCAMKEDHNARLDSYCEGVNTDCQIDAFRIGQVFRNLFENSIAACGDHAHISVRCENTLGLVQVTVRDNGPGLNEEQQENAFNPFFTTKVKGTGLGLAIAKRIIEAHGGQIRLGNCTAGAEFVISLPAEPA